MTHGEKVTLGGNEFIVEVVTPTYSKLHPVNKNWLYDWMDTLPPPPVKKEHL